MSPLTPPNACIDVPLFTSFQVGLVDPCPGNKTPKVTVFSNATCAGTAFGAGPFPSDRSPGECREVVASVGGQGLVSVGGSSAVFLCV